MLSDALHCVRPANEAERAYLESPISEDFARCDPGETLEDLKQRTAFSKEDRGGFGTGQRSPPRAHQAIGPIRITAIRR